MNLDQAIKSLARFTEDQAERMREAEKRSRVRIEAHAEVLRALDNEERLAVFNAFCKFCGGENKPCYCLSDD